MPKTHHVSRVYNCAAFLWLQFLVDALLFPTINYLYFYISSFRGMWSVLSMAVFCCSLIFCFPGMLPRCVCMCVRTYVRMYVYMYVRMDVCMYVRTYARMYVYMYVRMNALLLLLLVTLRLILFCTWMMLSPYCIDASGYNDYSKDKCSNETKVAAGK
jgi:hypothetical protein